jgi:hypothetical protein
MKKLFFIVSLFLVLLPAIADAGSFTYDYFFIEDFESGLDGWTTNNTYIVGNSDHEAKLKACSGCFYTPGYAELSMIVDIPENYIYPIFEYDRKTKGMGYFLPIDGDYFTAAWRPVGSDEWDVLETIKLDDNWNTKTYKLFERDLWDDNIDAIEIKFKMKNQGWEPWATCDYAYVDNVKLSGFHTPEPATLTLMSMGILGLFGIKRKKA